MGKVWVVIDTSCRDDLVPVVFCAETFTYDDIKEVFDDEFETIQLCDVELRLNEYF